MLQALEVEQLHDAVDDSGVMHIGAGIALAVRGPAQRDDFADTEAKGSGLFLQNGGDLLRRPARWYRPNVLPVDLHLPGCGCLKAVEQTQQRRFARPIGADHAKHAALIHLKTCGV